jgi:hypothetical protein
VTRNLRRMILVVLMAVLAAAALLGLLYVCIIPGALAPMAEPRRSPWARIPDDILSVLALGQPASDVAPGVNSSDSSVKEMRDRIMAGIVADIAKRFPIEYYDVSLPRLTESFVERLKAGVPTKPGSLLIGSVSLKMEEDLSREQLRKSAKAFSEKGLPNPFSDDTDVPLGSIVDGVVVFYDPTTGKIKYHGGM